MDTPRVLVIEDEPGIRRVLVAALASAKYTVVEAGTGGRGLVLAAESPPDLVILDLGLPDMEGRAVLARLREWSGVPVVILSARDQEREKVAALDAGADDYVVKPFRIGELLARMRVALRHRAAGVPEDPVISVGEFRIDVAAYRTFVGDREVHLTPLEFRLMSLLARNVGRVLTHRALLRDVWGPGHADEVHSLRVLVAGVRRKIEEDPTRPRRILTEQGVGYRFGEPRE